MKLSLESISYKINNRLLFRNVGFSLSSGSMIVLKGCNGSGKTTLLKIIAGLIKPTTGKITCNDVVIYDELSTYYEHFVSYHGVNHRIKDDLTIYQNITFWANMVNNIDIVEPVMSYFGFNHYRNIPCYKLSAGFKKKVALALLVIANKKIWLIDEPDTFLDVNSRYILQKLVELKLEQGGIIVVASHNLNQQAANCSFNLEDFKI